MGLGIQGRKATVIDAESYLLACSRYIEFNSVRAGIVAHPRDYRWSSYRGHADGSSDELITAHKVHRRLGLNADARQAAYRMLFRAALGEGLLDEIRDAPNKSLALGNDRFRDEIARLAGGRARPQARGRPQEKADRE